MEIYYYLRLVRQWLWLFGLTTLIAAGITFAVSAQTPPTYQAIVKLLIGPDISSSPDPQLNDLRTSAELMHTYAEIAHTEPFLEAVSGQLLLENNLALTPATLRRNLSPVSNDTTRILSLYVQDSNGEQAIIVANAFAKALVNSSPNTQANSDALLREQLQRELDKIPKAIATSEQRIAELEQNLQTTTNLDNRRQIIDSISTEQNRLDESQRTLVVLYDALQTTSTNKVTILESAVIAEVVPSDLPLRTLLGGLAGLILGLVIALVVDYTQDALHSAEDVVQGIDAPILTTFTEDQISFAHSPTSPIKATDAHLADTYRVLSARLLFAPPLAPPLQSILLAGLQDDDHLGELAASLVTTLAQTGRRVTIVDANLRYSTLGHLFGVTSQAGLVEALTTTSDIAHPATVDQIPGLRVLHSHPAAHLSFAMLASPQMTTLVTQLKAEADLLVILGDSAPSFTDNLILAPLVNGVILTIKLGVTRRKALQVAMENLRALGVRVVGAILIDKPPSVWDQLMDRMQARKRVPRQKPGSGVNKSTASGPTSR